MSEVWLFPGQGAEEPRMGLALAARCPEAARLLEVASDLVGHDVTTLLRRGGPLLARTEILQPVLTAVSLGAAAALRAAGCSPAAVAGHSLGELAAWSAAGAIGADDAIRLARERGVAMAEAAREAPGSMVALRAASEALLEQALTLGRAAGVLVVAAHNAPDEWVLAGDEGAVARVAAELGGRRLAVSGPWHAPAMVPAAARLEPIASRIATGEMAAPLVAGATGALVRDASALSAMVAAALVNPVRWTLVMRAIEPIASYIVTCGPGRVSRSLVRRNLGAELPVVGTESRRELDRIGEGLAP